MKVFCAQIIAISPEFYGEFMVNRFAIEILAILSKINANHNEQTYQCLKICSSLFIITPHRFYILKSQCQFYSSVQWPETLKTDFLETGLILLSLLRPDFTGTINWYFMKAFFA